MNPRNTDKNHLNKPIIGISIGDINGIGPEVIIKCLSDTRFSEMFVPVIYASGGVIAFYRKVLNLEQFNYHQCGNIADINPKKVNVINCWEEKIDLEPGKGSTVSGNYAKKSLEWSVADLKSEKIDAIVTAPLSKEFVKGDDFDFPGHTEYFTKEFEAADSLMLMVLGDLRVGVVTGHIPLKEVSHKLDKDVLRSKINVFLKTLSDDFDIKKPKLAVMGLNPHAGENGVLGSEDDLLIKPVLNEFKEDGHLIYGPFPADGFFGSGQFKQFDGVLAMYHDQGLIPFKTLTGGEGVNFTAGLSAIRTSPAHGTAYPLAGKNQADPTSMRNAIYTAIDMVNSKKSNTNYES